MCGSAIAQNIQELTKEAGVPSPPPELRLAFQVHLKMWKGQIKKFSEDEIDANAFSRDVLPIDESLVGSRGPGLKNLATKLRKRRRSKATSGKITQTKKMLKLAIKMV